MWVITFGAHYSKGRLRLLLNRCQEDFNKGLKL